MLYRKCQMKYVQVQLYILFRIQVVKIKISHLNNMQRLRQPHAEFKSRPLSLVYLSLPISKQLPNSNFGCS